MAEPRHKAGTEIRDDSGKLIARIVCDVYTGDVVKAEQFEYPDGSRPIVGDEMHPAIARVAFPVSWER